MFRGRRAAGGYAIAVTVIRCCVFEGQQYWLFLSWEESYAEYKTGLLTQVSECYMQDFEWMGICIFSWIDLNILSSPARKEKNSTGFRKLIFWGTDQIHRNTAAKHLLEKEGRDTCQGMCYSTQGPVRPPVCLAVGAFTATGTFLAGCVLLVYLSSVVFSLSAG